MDYVSILAKHFGVDESIITECVRLVEKKMVGVNSDDIYKCIMEFQGLYEEEEFLPELTSQIFDKLPISGFIKVCELTKRHALECKKPSYWLRYLYGRSREEWIEVIKYLSPDVDPELISEDEGYKLVILRAIVKEYRRIHDRSGLDFMFDVVNSSYTLDEVKTIIDNSKRSRIEIGELRIPASNKLKNMIRSTNYDYETKDFQQALINTEMKSLMEVVYIIKYLKHHHFDMEDEIKDFEENETISEIENIGDYAMAIGFDTLDQVINVDRNLGWFDTPAKTALWIISGDPSVLNRRLAKDIMSKIPEMKLSGSKKYIQKLLDGPSEIKDVRYVKSGPYGDYKSVAL